METYLRKHPPCWRRPETAKTFHCPFYHRCPPVTVRTTCASFKQLDIFRLLLSKHIQGCFSSKLHKLVRTIYNSQLEAICAVVLV